MGSHTPDTVVALADWLRSTCGSCSLEPYLGSTALPIGSSWRGSRPQFRAWSLWDGFFATLSHLSEFARLILANGLQGSCPFPPPLFDGPILPLSLLAVYSLCKTMTRTRCAVAQMVN